MGGGEAGRKVGEKRKGQAVVRLLEDPGRKLLRYRVWLRGKEGEIDWVVPEGMKGKGRK